MVLTGEDNIELPRDLMDFEDRADRTDRTDYFQDAASEFGQATDADEGQPPNLSFRTQTDHWTHIVEESHLDLDLDPEGSGYSSTHYDYQYLDLDLPNQERLSLSEGDGDWDGSLLTTAGSRKRRLSEVSSELEAHDGSLEKCPNYVFQTLQASINSSNSGWEASSGDDGRIRLFDDDRHLLIAQNHVKEDDEGYDVIIEDVVSDEGELISRKITTLTDEQADNKENNAMYSFTCIDY